MHLKFFRILIFSLLFTLLVAVESAFGLPVVSFVVLLSWNQRRNFYEYLWGIFWLSALVAVAYSQALTPNLILFGTASLIAWRVRDLLMRRKPLYIVFGIILAIIWQAVMRTAGFSWFNLVSIIFGFGVAQFFVRKNRSKFKHDINWWQDKN